ncbi:hypothetical protein A7U60_g6111 [Sanghuangporus baumii]|uniref:Altered inheritance of mitochondria protein 41 n=1 Tax=Sanghuangporus baumii TaxID=108892 RepID=A0A9Q5HVT8_SANBA|nr:hypothetical protein A7U60_g6111 [Sanghuangporus baumii]
MSMVSTNIDIPNPLRRIYIHELPVLDVRTRLTTELKNAMKSRNKFASTVLRSVLAEVYTADKNPSGAVSNSQIVSILRKAISRRAESAEKYAVASRLDLADTESREAKYLETFLPPSLSEADIDALLNKLAVEQNLMTNDPKRAMGTLLRSFFGQVDKALVDGLFVKQRAEVVLDKLRQK